MTRCRRCSNYWKGTGVPGNSGGFFPPIGYAWYWFPAGILAVALVLAWFGFVFWWTRRTKSRPGSAPVPLPPRWQPSARAKYLARIDQIAAQHDQGKIDARTANQQLSAAVRGFVHEFTGLPSDRMTLAELRALGIVPVTEAVAFFYPAAFTVHSRQNVAESVSLAQQVVRAWS